MHTCMPKYNSEIITVTNTTMTMSNEHCSIYGQSTEPFVDSMYIPSTCVHTSTWYACCVPRRAMYFRQGVARGSPFMAQHKKTCLHLNFSHAMALKLDSNVFQYKMNVYKENLIFSLNAYRTWQLAQLGLILKPVISRFRITKLVHTN